MRLLRCRRPPLSRQNDQALIVNATLYETGLLGVADRLVEGRTGKTDIATDALGSPPGMRDLGSKAVEVGDERRRAFETILVVVHLPGLLCEHRGCIDFQRADHLPTGPVTDADDIARSARNLIPLDCLI